MFGEDATALDAYHGNGRVPPEHVLVVDTREAMMSSFRTQLLALVLVVLCALQSRARAGDLEDCTGGAADRIEPACAAVIKDAARPPADRLNAYVVRSRWYANRSKLDAATADADAALQLNPQSIAALLSRGYARQRAGNFEAALADYNRAAELDPKNAIVFAARGGMRIDQKAWPEALADFNQSIALRQDIAAVYVGRGRAYTETGQLDAAMADLNTAISINDTATNAFFWRGQAWRRKGDADRAIEDFSRAIAQNPSTDRVPYFARAQAFSAKGDYARAIADFDKVISIAPDDKAAQQQRQSAIAMQAELARIHDNPPASGLAARTVAVAPAAPQAVQPPTGTAPAQLLDQARLLMAQKKFADVVSRLNPVLAADPNNEAALRLRAVALMASGRFAECRADIDAVLRLKPSDSEVLALRAMVSIATRQVNSARADIDRALAVNPNNAMAYLARGMADRITGKYQDAVADLARAIALNPKDSAAYAERGQAYMSLNQLDKAVVDFDQALVLNQANDLARAARGLALLMKGSTAEGLVDIKNALDRNPNNQLAQVGQGLAMLVSGQYDRAIVALNQLIGKAAAFDTFARVLRARAYLARKDTADAMADLNLVLGTHPNDADALRLRGIAFSGLREYDKALDDLSKAIAVRETVESYFARAKIYEVQNNIDKATDDFRKATQLAATSVFDVLAQAELKRKIQQLSKRIPCGGLAKAPSDGGTCL